MLHIVSEVYEKIRETGMPRGEFKHRYWFLADTLNIAKIGRVIWKDLLWSSDSYRLHKYRGGCTIPLFQLSVWCEKCVVARHYAVICKQLWIWNDRYRFLWARREKRKKVEEKTTTKLKNKQTPITTVRNHLQTVARFPAPLLFHYTLLYL